VRQIATVVVVLVLTAGCGSATSHDGAGRPASVPSSKASEPAGSRSSSEVSTAPPDAYLETPAGRVQLTLGSYCWSSTNPDGSGVGACADMAPPGMREDLAEVPVVLGDHITLMLGFRPTKPIDVTIGGHTWTFPPAETLSWTVQETGILSAFMYTTQGDVSYAARLVGP
jgi:uncharacterized protein YceK